jgi:glucosylceramidase
MKKTKKNIIWYGAIIAAAVAIILLSRKQAENETRPPVVTPPAVNEMDCWLTTSDGSVKLQKQTTVLSFGTRVNQYQNIEVNEATGYQTVDGFGYTLTGGSAAVINTLTADKKQELLQELFGNGETSIKVSYLRLSIGASDLNAAPFSYDDIEEGHTDMELKHFNFAQDSVNTIPLLKEILAINPAIKIIATPWSPPVWMKDNNSFVGGSLQPQYYAVYALYFVKYIKAMQSKGITIDAITPQNEPLHPGNNPSMLMTAVQQADFIKNHLGPAFQNAGINTKIIIYDHNCDKPDYPISILNDAAAKAFIDGSAFHLYAGDISALSAVKSAHPDKSLYFTEQYTASNGTFGGDLSWHVKNVIIGSMRNWSRNALEWNLANDATYGPHTDGGCTTCKGAITIDTGNGYTKNVAYYIIAHASKFVPANSTRIESAAVNGLSNVAFKTPGGKKVLIVQNDSSSNQTFNIRYNGKWVVASLDKGAVATFVW